MKRIIPNTKKIKLTKSELDRTINLAPNGQSAKFDKNGETSLRLIKSLAKAKLKAGRFALYSDQLGKRLYIGAIKLTYYKADRSEAPFTFVKSEALEFFEGFDDPAKKIKHWEMVLQEFTKFQIKLNFVQTKKPKNEKSTGVVEVI
jgi:hypothetical protein